MQKYVVMYRAPMTAMEQMQSMAAEDMQKEMQLWMDWAAACGDSLVDMGAPLVGGVRLTESGSAPTDSSAIAYSILQTENIEAAQAFLKGHPHFRGGDGFEIDLLEGMAMPG